MGVNQYPSHRTESRGPNCSPFIWMGERHFGECLWLGVLQCMSSVLWTEKDTPSPRALASSVPKSFCSRRMMQRYEREATMRAKSST